MLGGIYIGIYIMQSDRCDLQAQLCLPLNGDRGSPALRDIAATRKRGRLSRGRSTGRRSSNSSTTAKSRCRHCGAPVEIPGWLLAQGLENYYCNAECRRAWTLEEVKEPKRTAPARSKATDSRHRGANWRVQSKAARQRDRYTCRVCGLTEDELGKRLHVHHTIPYSRFKSNVEANKLDYLVSVCPSCHGQLEAQLRRDLPLFADLVASDEDRPAEGATGRPAPTDDRRQILGGN